MCEEEQRENAVCQACVPSPSESTGGQVAAACVHSVENRCWQSGGEHTQIGTVSNKMSQLLNFIYSIIQSHINYSHACFIMGVIAKTFLLVRQHNTASRK